MGLSDEADATRQTSEGSSEVSGHPCLSHQNQEVSTIALLNNDLLNTFKNLTDDR